MGVAVEAAELMECFLWLDLVGRPMKWPRSRRCREAIADEMADVLCYLQILSNVLGIDLMKPLRAKMVKNAVKYPAEQYRGKYQV